MKMSEHFKEDEPEIKTLTFYNERREKCYELPYALILSGSQADAAKHAINMYDPLVEALTGLLKAYEGLEGHQTAQGSWHSHAKAVLAKEEQGK